MLPVVPRMLGRRGPLVQFVFSSENIVELLCRTGRDVLGPSRFVWERSRELDPITPKVEAKESVVYYT